jgi:hypothetical protein
MARFVLVPGAGRAAWSWHRVVPLLEQAKHEAIAVDLPGDIADFELLRYLRGPRRRGCALGLTSGFELGPRECQGELVFDPRDLVARGRSFRSHT